MERLKTAGKLDGFKEKKRLVEVKRRKDAK
jgi:hypothetical protein